MNLPVATGLQWQALCQTSSLNEPINTAQRNTYNHTINVAARRCDLPVARACSGGIASAICGRPLHLRKTLIDRIVRKAPTIRPTISTVQALLAIQFIIDRILMVQVHDE
ncbi:hypothetical protein ACU4GR_28020 [Methylobacterium oryzae CBMB20]